jgi:hypothetical protein
MHEQYVGEVAKLENKDEIPLKYELRESEFLKPTLRTLAEKENIVVRTEYVGDGKEEFRARIGETLEDMDVFKELKNKHGVPVADFSLFIGKDDAGKYILYNIVEKIDGKNLDETEHLPIEARERVDTFFESLAKHYFDVYKNGGRYWSDFYSSQVVWGKKRGSSAEELIVVDVGPASYTFNPLTDRDDTILEEGFKRVVDYMIVAEGKFDSPALLSRSRETLRSMLDEILKTTKNVELASRLRRRVA